MFCPQCGKPLADGARFCGNCGASIAPSAPAPQPALQPAPVPQAPTASAIPPEPPPPPVTPRVSSMPPPGAVPPGGIEIHGLIERVKRILMSPKTEWPVIAAEPRTARDIYFGYVAPLAAIGVIASLIVGKSVANRMKNAENSNTQLLARKAASRFAPTR